MATEVQKYLVVAGPRDGVERFAKLQGSLKPPLETSMVKSLGNNRAEAKVTLPAGYEGDDLVHTTREAWLLVSNISLKSVEPSEPFGRK